MEEPGAEPAVLPGSELFSGKGDVLELYKLHQLSHPVLLELSRQFNLRVSHERTRHQLIFDLLKAYSSRGVQLIGEGMLEITSESYGVLRWERYNFTPCPEDVYVSAAILKKHGIRPGNKVRGYIRGPKEKEKFMAMEQVISIEGIPLESWSEPKHFDQLTALFPDKRILLENPKSRSVSARAVDLIAPLGRGQRGLIVAAPRTGKTLLLRDIALAIRANSPDVHLILRLVDERPEEVTDLRRCLDCEIYSSTFDEPPTRHVQVAELVSERAKRLVEQKKDVVILLDSLTRLSRGYNSLVKGKGRTMSGGVESKALLKPKRFFGAARNVEEGGSLTILATALIETGSRMDEVIFEEFKGTGNSEVILDRKVADKRIFPAIDVLKSGTRKEELITPKDQLQKTYILRRILNPMGPQDAIEFLLDKLRQTKNNGEFFQSMNT